MSTPSAQAIESKYHFPLEGPVAAWRNGDSRAGANFYLRMHSFFVCKDKPETCHTRKQKISKDVYSLHKRQESWEEIYSILNGRGQFHKGLRKLTAVYRPYGRIRTLEKSHSRSQVFWTVIKSFTSKQNFEFFTIMNAIFF